MAHLSREGFTDLDAEIVIDPKKRKSPKTPQNKQCQKMDPRSAADREFEKNLGDWAGNISNGLAIAAAIPTPASPALAGLALLGKGLSLAAALQLSADIGRARRTGDYARLKSDAASAVLGLVPAGKIASRATMAAGSAAGDKFGQAATDAVYGAGTGALFRCWRKRYRCT